MAIAGPVDREAWSAIDRPRRHGFVSWPHPAAAPLLRHVRSRPTFEDPLELFHGGRFGDSILRCKALWTAGVRSLPLQALLGELRLWQTRPSEAAELLSAALTEKPDSPCLKAILAESYRRSDRLSQAAALHRELGRVALADKLGVRRRP